MSLSLLASAILIATLRMLSFPKGISILLSFPQNVLKSYSFSRIPSTKFLLPALYSTFYTSRPFTQMHNIGMRIIYIFQKALFLASITQQCMPCIYRSTGIYFRRQCPTEQNHNPLKDFLVWAQKHYAYARILSPSERKLSSRRHRLVLFSPVSPRA